MILAWLYRFKKVNMSVNISKIIDSIVYIITLLEYDYNNNMITIILKFYLGLRLKCCVVRHSAGHMVSVKLVPDDAP